MGACGRMGNRKSVCLYIDEDILETAKRIGLNASKVSENALEEAISRFGSPKMGTGLYSPARVWGRDRDLNPGARLHRPVGFQATSSRPRFPPLGYSHCFI